MSSSFPTSVDSFPVLSDGTSNVLAAHQNDRADAIVATETKVGADGDALSATTVEGRLKFQETGGLKRYGTPIASASSIALPDGYDIFRLTGGVTIATITAPSYNRLVFLEFAAALTLDHGAGNLNMTAGADYITVAEEVVPFEWNGTSWHQVGSPGLSASSFATPALTLGTANSAGAASTVIRSDATIAAFDATAPTTQVMGDSAATGSAAVAARRDHKHGMPAFATTSDIADTAATESAGSASTVPRGDHVHAQGAHDHAGSAGDGGKLTNEVHDGYSVFEEIAAPSSPSANTLRLYAKDSSGVTKLFYKDDGGTEVGPLGAAVAADHDHTTGGDGGKLTAPVFDSFAVLEETTAPSAPGANTLRLYAKDNGSGDTELYYKNSAGTERDLGAAAAGSLAAHDHTSGGGDGGVLSGDQHDSFSEYDEIAAPSTPASGKVRLYAKSDGLFYSKDDAGTETAVSGGSGGGGGFGQLSPLTAPATASPFTAWVNQGSTTATDESDGLYLLGVGEGSGRNFRGRVEAVPGSTPWTRTLAFLPFIDIAGNNPMVGLFLTDGTLTSSKVSAMEWISSSQVDIVAVEDWNTVSGGSATTRYAQRWGHRGPMVWFRVTDNGTNIIWSLSSDGVHFPVVVYSASRTNHFAAGPTHVGIFLSSNNSNTVPAIKALHYA